MIICPNEIATGRSNSLFAADMNTHGQELTKRLKGARVLVIGGAGSIGTATAKLLSAFPLDQLTVVDHNENALAGLVRRLRAEATLPLAKSIDTLPLDFGHALFYKFLQSAPPFDFVLNFAALKHVRTEKDVFSALALIEANIVRQADLLIQLGKTSPKAQYFSVSTDKAANPVSVMGATKRLMEHVMFQSSASECLTGAKITARFANVAYSNGSLLESFVQRLNDRVPLAAPVGIERFFVSLEEAGQLCLLASILGEDQTIYVPKLDPAENLVAMERIARDFLNVNGFEADIFTLEDETDAKTALEDLALAGRWPLVLTPADTAGEKPYEEFTGEHETTALSAFHELYAVKYASALSSEEIDASLGTFRALLDGESDAEVSLEDIKTEIANLEPRFSKAHIASEKRLDDRI